MLRFVYTPRGYVNLDGITEARFKRTGGFELYAGDTPIDADHPDFPDLVVSVLPVTGDWECLSVCAEEDGSDSLWSEPVLAWGFTVTGHLIPITPSETSGVADGFALRRAGTTRIHEAGFGEYEDETSWLQAHREAKLLAANIGAKKAS
jgi:hypothetical protein